MYYTSVLDFLHSLYHPHFTSHLTPPVEYSINTNYPTHTHTDIYRFTSNFKLQASSLVVTSPLLDVDYSALDGDYSAFAFDVDYSAFDSTVTTPSPHPALDFKI